MNPRYLKKQLQTPSVNSFLLHKNENSSQGRTERRANNGSIGKTPLADLTNQPEAKPHSKLAGRDMPLQSSTEALRSTQKLSSSNIAASKWLDSEKEMMEFIMNLKAKKHDQRASKAKRTTEGFQMDERREEAQDFLCNKMLFLKKIEKHEKEAVGCFYEKDYEKCFSELAKAEALIRKEKIETVQHQLYIHYLYSQFYYKLNQHEKWKSYLLKAKHYVSKVSSNEEDSMREYIMNITALEICLAAHEEHYDKVLAMTQHFGNYEQLSSKIRRRISHSRITALHKQCKFKEAMEAIDMQCQALQSDHQINSERQAQEIGKLLTLKIEMTAEFTSTQRAIELLEQIVNFQEVSNGTAENFSYYHLKVYQLYAELLKKDQQSLLKLIFFYQKWIDLEPSKKEKLKLQLQLFKMYYQIGVYQRALELFDSISSQNLIYLGPEYLFILASIKHSYGQRKQAVNIMLKIIDLCQDEDAKMLNSCRILEFDLEEESHTLRQERERILERGLKTYNGPNHDSILQLYHDYLKRRGESDRAFQLCSKMKKTATFQQFFFNQRSSSKLKR